MLVKGRPKRYKLSKDGLGNGWTEALGKLLKDDTKNDREVSQKTGGRGEKRNEDSGLLDARNTVMRGPSGDG